MKKRMTYPKIFFYDHGIAVTMKHENRNQHFSFFIYFFKAMQALYVRYNG
ncbi:Uncharacterized protein dnm_057980 [Desulfonema magnum]|uniref:Uncharacterized protein n=1 Tax=Desulfonema magnum TaxID=45655 RepID=A0A975GQ68_9BACT|nr:Uncharacterized protein dnm_057980 [Desulfonema magnum]